MADIPPIIFVIDDDPSFRRSLKRLSRSAGFKVKPFGSGEEFLRNGRPDGPACLVLDVALHGSSGLDLQRDLSTAGFQIPTIFVTGHGDIPMAVRAMKAGAIEFLTKPCSERELLEALHQGIELDRSARSLHASLAHFQEHYHSLTPREREVMAGIVSGLLNKQIAAELGTTEKTIKFHRGHVMQKMQAGSLADLVRLAVLSDTGPKASRIAHPEGVSWPPQNKGI